MESSVSSTSIKVICRIKPLPNSLEERAVHVSSDRDISLASSSSLFSSRHFRLNKILDEDASQQDVFENVIPILRNFFDGFNCTCILYGQTGTGFF